MECYEFVFLFSSRRRYTICLSDWSSDVCSSDLGPRFVEPLFKSAALVRPPIVIVARGHDRTYSREMRRMCNRRQHLGSPDIRASIHSHSAIGIRQRCRPFDSVVAVVRFMQKGIPFAVRCVASADILVDHDVAAGRALMAKIDVAVAVFIVGSSREKNWESSWCHGPINVGTKHGAIAHGHSDAVFNGHGIGFGCKNKLRNDDKNYERAERDNSVDSPRIQADHSFSAGFSTNRIKPKRSGT